MKSIWSILALVGTVGMAWMPGSALADVKPGTAVVREITGRASYVDAKGTERALVAGMVLGQGDTVRTEAESYLHLYLQHNGPVMGFGPKSSAKLATLQYEETDLGTVKDTIVDLQAGTLYGKVDKLVGRSRYEVHSPLGVAQVKGTDFYVDLDNGNVRVLSGKVFLLVIMRVRWMGAGTPGLPNPVDNSFSKAVEVNAGQSFTMPPMFDQLEALQNYVAASVPTPPGWVPPPSFFHYLSAGNDLGIVTSQYDTGLAIDPATLAVNAYVVFPPSIRCASP